MKNDFLPLANLEVLRQRAEIMRRVRRFFDDRNFFEIETPVLSHDVLVDRYLNPIGISKKDVTGRSGDADEMLWLQTSPEFGMKRVLAAGAEAIYQICKSFRQGETGDRHNPEFTMLEWYRSGDDMQTGMELLSEFVEVILKKSRTRKMTYREAFRWFTDIDPFEATLEDLETAARKNGVSIDEHRGANRDGWLNLILSEVVEPQLGLESPVIVYDWPESQAALATVRPGSPPVAERFEVYVDGVELANGYHELLDAEELVKRNSINNQHRVKDGSHLLPEESRLLDAMRHGIPGCAGVALGVDRLVMLALGASSIREIVAFPIERA
jgi:lysyl-tRNA synthetase class 2